MSVDMDEQSALDALERQTYSSNGNGEDDVDQSLLYQHQQIDMSDADDLWEPGRYLFVITSVTAKKSKKPPNHWRYLALGLTCEAGPRKGQLFPNGDNVMIEGDPKSSTWKKKLNAIGKATDLYDYDSKCFVGQYGDILNKVVWADVVTEKSTWNGEERERSKIAFVGYHHFAKFEMPAEDDLFAEVGEAILVEEVEETYLPEGEEVIEEAPAPAPARPATTRPTAARPAAARPGTKPPF